MSRIVFFVLLALADLPCLALAAEKATTTERRRFERCPPADGELRNVRPACPARRGAGAG